MWRGQLSGLFPLSTTAARMHWAALSGPIKRLSGRLCTSMKAEYFFEHILVVCFGEIADSGSSSRICCWIRSQIQ